MKQIEEVLVVGAGTMGRQIALQCAMCGYRATLYDVSREALHEARAMMQAQARALSGSYVSDSTSAILERVYVTLDLEEAAASADLVSECAPEDPDVKRRVFAQIGELAPPQAILTTNSSSLVPSALAEATGRPDRFLSLHFHSPVWVASVADVMPHSGTRPEVVLATAAFVRSLRQKAIVLPVESRGYVFNSMLFAYTRSALSLWMRQIASFEDIDRAWMIVEGTAQGPFGKMDSIGLDIVYDTLRCEAETENNVESANLARRLKKDFIARGRLGVKSGEGFYSYPGPAFGEADFLTR